jgi:hypothetical protein
MPVSQINQNSLATGVPSSIVKSALPSGSVLQVVSTIKNDRWSQSVAAPAWSSDITGYTATITPTSASSKILISFILYRDSSSTAVAGPRILQDGVVINTLTGDADGSRTKSTGGFSFSTEGRTNDFATGSYLIDAGSTSARTYSFQVFNVGSNPSTLYVNRSGQYATDAYDMLPCSSIVLMEIAA